MKLISELKDLNKDTIKGSHITIHLAMKFVGMDESQINKQNFYNDYAKGIPEAKCRFGISAFPGAKDKFKFYYVGDLNDRKNVETILTCFHSEFDKSENAVLILKVKKPFANPEEVKNLFDEEITKIKSSLRMYPSIEGYNKDIIITSDISEEEICSLHQYGDCFVSPSHGEAWSIPSFEAMAFGNTPICSNFGGPKEFITNDENTGKCIEGVYSVCKCSDAAFPDIFTGREFWFQPCEKQIRSQMRKYYEQYKEDPIKHKREAKIAGLESAKRFSYENIGNKMKELLDE